MRIAPIFLLVPALAACSGGPAITARPTPTASALASLAGTIRPQLEIVRSARAATALRRSPARVGADAVSVTVSVTPPIADLPPSVTTDLPANGCTAIAPCTVGGPPLPPGVANTLIVETFDAADGSGRQLDSGTTSITPVVGADTTKTIVLEGVPASVAFAAIGSLAPGAKGSEPLGITVADADGEPILGTFATPIVVTDLDASGPIGSQLSGPAAPVGSCATGTCVQLSSSSDVATLEYGGLAEGSQTVTSTVTSPAGSSTTTASFVTAPVAGIWVTAWGAAMAPQLTSATAATNQSFRTIVKTSVGSRGLLRIHLSNVDGTSPVTVNAAHVALAGVGTAVVAASDRALTFAGAGSITIPAGSSVYSDATMLPYSYGTTIAVTTSISGPNGLLPHHNSADQIQTYLTASGSGDETGDLAGTTFTTGPSSQTLLLDRVDLFGAYMGTVALAGSSTTVGFGAPAQMYEDLPDVIAADLHAAGRDDLAIANMAVIPDAILARNDPLVGTKSVLERFSYDFLALPSIRTIVQLAGDVDIKSGCDTALDVIGGNQQIIAMAHAANVRVVLGTVPPSTYCNGENPGGFGTRFPAGIQQDGVRDLVNAWTVSTAPSTVSGTTVQPPGADAIVDISTPVTDPTNTGYLLVQYDAGDDAHLDAAGQAIQAAIVAGAPL